MFYCQRCQEVLYIYTPLSDSSLWKILQAVKPLQKKSLAGLNDDTATGMNGFQTLEKFVQEIKMKETEDKLERGKCNIKNSYRIHCSDPDGKR